jgi:tetratricopeptide (TPR) repeat protein
MAETLVAQHREDEAEPLYTTALAVSTELHDLENIVHTQTRLAALYARTDRQDQASTLATQAFEQARKMHYRRGMANALVVLGDVARVQGNDETARRQYVEAHRLYTILHDPAAKRLEDYLPQSA